MIDALDRAILEFDRALRAVAPGRPLKVAIPGPLSFAEHPIVRAQILEKEISLGLKSTFQAMRELRPRLSPQESRDMVIRIAKEEAELNTIYIEHNIPRDATSRRASIAALQGRLGGLTGGGPSDEENNDDGNDPKPGRASQ